jgi:hypothetical protein
MARRLPRLPERWRAWASDLRLVAEIFALFNFACLALDIYLAHSTNAFHRPSEYVPLYFSIVAALALAGGLAAKARWGYVAVWRDVGYLVGWTAIVVGLAGVVLHLDSRFFVERTIKSLTYAAPFAAPLAYTGLGLLLVMNRMIAAETAAWAYWALLLAVGGFAGNFVFSLTDHAVNGFFRPVEWLAVAASAFAVSFLIVPFVVDVGRAYVRLCAVVLVVEAAVGTLGFLLHAAADLEGPSPSMFENVVFGAPPFAPLLFPNVALLGAIALWALYRHLPETAPEPAPATGA